MKNALATRRLLRKPRNMVAAARRLKRALAGYTEQQVEGKVEFILNPLEYGWSLYESYLERFAPTEPGQIEAVFLGMNPGPWGMNQTGVPFGSPDMVREFLKLEGRIRAPRRQHPKRPVLGLDCHRNEVSGQRLWGGIAECFGTPEAFFERFLILNYCPLTFQGPTGANVTPDKLPKPFMAPVIEACDQHLVDFLRLLQPQSVIGVGKWAEKQARTVVEREGLDVRVSSILHPSPASPLANRGWLPAARRQLRELGHPW